MNRSEQLGKLRDVRQVEPPSKQHRFPVFMRLRHRLHGQQVWPGIEKDQRGDGAGRRQFGQAAHADRFALDSAGVAEPFDLHAEFGQRLLKDPGLAVFALNQDGAVGDAAREIGETRGFIWPDPGGMTEVSEQRGKVFDVEMERVQVHRRSRDNRNRGKISSTNCTNLHE